MKLPFALSCLGRAALFVGALWLAAANLAFAKDDNVIRFSTDSVTTSLPLWYAEDNKLFAKHGLKYSEMTVNVGSLGLKAIGAGQNDASFQTDLPTAINIAAGVDALIVAVISKSDKGFGMVARKPFKSIADLKGKKVAWLSGSGGELSFSKYLEGHGASLNDFQHINLQPAEAVPSLVTGSIDALWFWQPWLRKAVALDPSKFEAIAYSDKKYYEANMILTVGRAFAKDKPETLKKFIAVMIESIDALNKNPDVAVALLTRHLRMKPADGREALPDWPMDVNLTGDFAKEFASVAQWKSKHGGLKSSPDWKAIIDPTYLRAVAPSKVVGF
jgi:ABC-type nitrate/sulfonate/bicarbonate transport system substrate-binding protein